jgi:hypothetical protein
MTAAAAAAAAAAVAVAWSTGRSVPGSEGGAIPSGHEQRQTEDSLR